ncbi:hypothetical protein HY745_02555 [Candidatus Desantisbacteria bacterium]|nr:hypothetical protein [Candidatus Desantisbacteria bacterium]
MLTTEEIKAILKPQFGFLGKGGEFKEEPLWVHAFTLWSIASKIIKFIPRFDDKERRLLEITVLIHDIGKMSDKNQSILSGGDEGRVGHTQTKEQIKAYFENHGLIEEFALSERDIDFIYHAHLHHDLPEEALKTAPPSLAIYADIVRYADWLASQERVDRQLIQRISNSLEPFCQITLVNISRPDGPSNYLLFDTAYNIYKETGWDVLSVFPNSLLLIAPKNALYPTKNEIVQKFQDRLIRESLLLQKPVVTNFASVLLAGESAKNPKLYLEVHKEYIIETLGDFEKSHLLFFKLLIEIIDISGKLVPDIKEAYLTLDILKGLSGTRGIPIARKKWIDSGGKITEPLKEMLKEMFNFFSLNKVVPFEIFNNEDAVKILKQVSAEELYNILYKLTEKLFPNISNIAFQNALDSLISMEEEADFREIAINRFEKYKEYKATQNPEKGICESCGFVIAFPTQKSLNFPGGKRWGFSQINAHTDSARATCTLCAYDTMIMRKDIPESKSSIYVRLESKSADIWFLYDDISKLIQNLDASFSNPYELENLNENSGYGFLPVPKTFKMPKFKEKTKYILQGFNSVRGYIIPITRVDNNASPKDLRAKYLSLYALLKMMGFDAHIGFEEQNGLFGDNPIAKHGEDYESLYYRGLAVKYLARITKKDSNAHVFAEALLTKSPSTALSKICESVEDNKIKQERVIYIMEAIVKGDFKISKNGGEYTMKELLQDAAFFSEGIPAFIRSKKNGDYDAWYTKSSKHLITKPVSKTMNSILQGDDFETAFAKFLSLIRENISSDKTKEDSEGKKPKVDINDLKPFVEKTKEILKRYYNLRENDVSSFIQAKNALLSSIYLLKRYPNIKEVVNG